MLIGRYVVALIDDSNRNNSKPGLDMYLPRDIATEAGWNHAENVKLALDQGEPWIVKIGLKAPHKPYLRRPVSRSGQKASLRNLFLALGFKDKDQVLLYVEAGYLLRFERILGPLEKLKQGTGIWPRSEDDGGNSHVSWSSRTLRDLNDELASAERKCTEEGEFDPENLEDAREVQMRAVVRRRGPVKFRKKLIEAYDSRCAFTGCDCIDVLEAAHIVSYRGEATNHVSNGLLLRADVHTLFDLGLIAVDSASYEIILSSKLLSGGYSELAGRQLRLPSTESAKPSKKALDLHRKQMVV